MDSNILPVPSFVDISPAKDGSVKKRLLQTGTVDLNFSDDDYVHFQMSASDPLNPEIQETPFVYCLRFGNPSFQEIVRTMWKSMQQGEVSEFLLNNVENSSDMFFPAIRNQNQNDDDNDQAESKVSTLLVKIEMIGLFEDDITKVKDKGVLRFRLRKGEGSTTPNDGANVHCHLIVSWLGFKLDERDVEFTLGEECDVGIPHGVEFAIMQMKLHEKSRFVIKRRYAPKSELLEKIAALVQDDYEELIYEIRLNKFENAKEVWQLSNEDRLKEAKAYKEKGNDYFKRQRYDMAIKFYGKVVYYLGPLNDQHFKKDNEEKNQVLSSGYLNLAQTFLNIDKPFDALKNCDFALQIDPDNVKAHFRKGLAHFKCKEYDLAIVEFERVLQLDAKNRAAAKELALCRQHIRAQKEKERSTFKNMFDKFAYVDKAREHTEEEKQKDVWKELSVESDFRTPEGDRFSDLPIKMIQ